MIGTNLLKILVLRTFPSLANGICIASAEPVLEEIGILLLALSCKLQHALLPKVVGHCAISVIHLGKKIAFKHISRIEPQASIAHRLKDRISLIIGRSGDLDQINLEAQPVNEVR